MAVKKQQDGKKGIPSWTFRPCIKCARVIEKQADGYRVKSIEFINARKSVEWHWLHRKCLDTK